MAKKKRRGRPSDYRSEYAELAEKVCRLGATDAELADILGCSVPTFYRWQAQFPEFRKAIKLGKQEPDDRVERALYQRAVGYTHPDVHVSNYQGAVTLTPIMKHYPPDTAAAFIWLKNRRPELWRDKQEVEHTGLNLAELLKVARERAGLSEEPTH